MPSSYSAKENKALVATCSSCQKSLPTVTMVTLPGRDNGKPQVWAVCIPCANKGWRPPGFNGVYQVRPE